MSTDFSLYIQACTHRSYTREKGGVHNEKLEFLGDSVLQLVITEVLIERFPKETEGYLSQMRHKLVNNSTLASCARSIRLGELIRMGRGEESTGGRSRERILANTFEACLAAVYLTLGFEAVRKIIDAHFLPLLSGVHQKRAKQRLHEWAQKTYRIVPEYIEISRVGPAHDLCFRVLVSINGTEIAVGEGKSFKEATNVAAEIATAKLEI